MLLLVAERRYRDFEILGADGSRVATLHRTKRGSFVLRRASPATSAEPELAAFILDDREVPHAPSRPRLNHMSLAAVKPTPTLAELLDRASIGNDKGGTAKAAGGAATAGAGGSDRGPTLPEPSPQYTRVLGRPAGELLAALEPGAPSPPPASLLVLESRLPVWDEKNQLLTLDYPPGRANLASVQNFQLLPSVPAADGAATAAASDAEDAAFTAALVHGLIHENEALETFSLDLRHPLSPLLAFAACLAAQDWE